jgi:hypothetical protein
VPHQPPSSGDEAQGGDVAATTERRRAARWTQIVRPSLEIGRPSTISCPPFDVLHLVEWFPLAEAALHTIRAYSRDTL